MIRSLRTGVSGLKSNQTRMDVVGNNIANVNTVAFKRSRVAFNEVLGQQLLGVGRTAGGTGVNPSSVGLGVSVGSIDQNWTQGALESTGVSTDLSLSGDGFFVARAGDRNMLTRAGNFTFNRNGEFVTANGLNVQGWSFDEDGQLVTGALQDVTIDQNKQAPARSTTEAMVGGNLSPDALDTETISVSTVIYDDQGKSHNVVVDMQKDSTTPNTWTYNVKYAGDPAESPFPADVDGNLTGGSGTFEMNVDGTFSGITSGSLSFDWDTGYVEANADGSAKTFSVDLSGLTQMAGSTTATVREQNGNASGTLAGYSITPEGVLQLSFSNGEQEKLFQLAIGNVNNPNGLEQQGENFYTTSSASGDLQLGRAGRDMKTAVVAGTLEMSNVDLATEFTDMIVAQRGYQASARIITTSDEMLQETVQLKR